MDELSSDSDILLNSERSQTFGNEDVAEVDADEVPSDTEDVLEGKEPGKRRKMVTRMVMIGSPVEYSEPSL